MIACGLDSHMGAAVKERPILFSGAMVRALLAGTKTQTRRIVKPQPPADKPRAAWFEPGVMGWAPLEAPSLEWHRVRCPYGQPGDRLWVREAFSGPHHQDRHPPRDWHSTDPIHCWADGNPTDGDWTKPRPGMFMPRWASRITLEITGVRVERLQDISEADAVAEGCEAKHTADADYTARRAYTVLWESINGGGSWSADPWVWVVEFRRVERVAA